MKVRATDLGFYGGSRRRAGDVFEVKDGTKAKWFEPVEEAPPAAKPKADPAEKLKAELAKLEASLAKAPDNAKAGLQAKIDAKQKEIEALASASDLA